ncbi:alpha/beta fold hydrolase [Deinococcus sp. Marseille-Q6407]|uniref:alpha/beta fold hydrolase n=1 Tax=Deinococcus sp. Marseille-Q6407 TaxID=2969223 RepID=UPI0021BE40DA|nr:alpha/beta hydrolase [Deinococcus sp. Marseille-Q6407]
MTDFFADSAADGSTAVLNGAELYFAQQPGNPERPPVVFLHGGPGYNSFSFQEIFGERLEQLDWPAIYLDQRGCGRSAPLEDTEQGDQLDLDTLVEDLEALRQHLELEQIIPLGHGFGALIALEYARRYPQHTARVVTVNPWVHFPQLALTLLAEASALKDQPLNDPAEEIRAQTPEDEYPAVGGARVQAAFDLLNARDLLNALQFPDPQARMRLEFVDAEGQLTGRAEVGEALVYQGLWEFEYPPFLQDITRPIFVIAGVHDRSSYPEQTDWLQDLGDADLTVLDSGHYPWLDDEDAFAEALQEALTR